MEEQNNEIKTVHTSCKDCSFAIYEDVEGRPTQVGCKMGRTEKYQRKNLLVEACDEDKDFYVVNTACPAYATKEVTFTLEEVRKAISVKIDILIFISKVDNLFNQLDKTIGSLTKQILQPNSIFFIVNNKEISVPKIISYLKTSWPTVDWNITQIQEENTSQERCVDLVFSKLNGHYYLCINNGELVPKDALSLIDINIIDDLNQFMVIRPFSLWNYGSENDLLVVSKQFHKTMNGNFPAELDGVPLNTILEKAEHLASQFSMKNIIINWSDLDKPTNGDGNNSTP